MAGLGSRFTEAGYKEAKPFIDVLGKPMIHRVINNFYHSNLKLQFIFIVHKTIKAQLVNLLNTIEVQNIVIDIDFRTEGAACTCLLAKELINNSSSLIIGDCDHLIQDPFWLDHSIDYFNQHNADGGLYNFWVDLDLPKWSYSQIANGRIIQVAEKNPISNAANTGRYYFKHGSEFVKAAEQMISKGLKTRNEYYVAPVFNELIFDGKLIKSFFVNQMSGLGTPQDLEKYLKRSSRR